ncbi:hypothetical protein B0A49_02381 [Cryomyces minteri]|uniref:ORC6 first cyclin-like domain-containing protein n=1 Tax=Cryomyces minteri TaxID=331657 RepID=A0A4U0XGH4_9PEZI|nr:hypothetical protein B0A49_02381 [Cryomyces minteri]
MNKQSEQALAGLIPTLSGPLPSELLSLAVSLLAQSRNKAGSLKAEEEIGRTYACAHIACERLKVPLDLPDIEPRPPCPPRIYKKLFQYLNTALPAKEPRTPSKSKARQSDLQNGTPKSTPSRKARTTTSEPTTPSKPPTTPPEATATAATSAGTSRKRKRHELQTASSEADVPEWVMSAIRHVCKAFANPAAAPHVYAGICSVLRLQTLSHTNSADRGTTATATTFILKRAAPAPAPAPAPPAIDEATIPALILVIYFYTARRQAGFDVSPESYQTQKSTAMVAMCELAAGQAQSAAEMSRAVEALMLRAHEEWLDMEWFSNVPEGDAYIDAEVEKNDGDGDGEDDEERGARTRAQVPRTPLRTRRVKGGGEGNAAGLQAGLGTMFQDRLDWLSEGRREEYEVWKAGVLRRVEGMERARERGVV